MGKDEEWEVYVQYRGHLLTQLQASYEHFDKAILTLSGGGLILSMAFIEKIVPLVGSQWKWALIASWVFFSFSILCTLISFLVSQGALRRQIEYADKCLAEQQEEYRSKVNPFSGWVGRLNCGAAMCFVIAVLSIVLFAGKNVS